MKQISVVIIGAGNRGCIYARRMRELPGNPYKVVAVADPVKTGREEIRRMYDLPESACYEKWEDLLEQPRLADLAVIATKDDMHYLPAMRAIEKGYNLLLEKPAAQTARECVDIAVAAKRKGVIALVCHVMRYTAFFGTIKDLLMAGTIGDVVSIEQIEGVGNLTFCHAYVRGNWCREADATPMLMAKCCHDLDMIQWLLDKPCTKVQSFGSLFHFKPENAPEGAPKRCTDGCPVADTCPYNSIRFYYEDKNKRQIITHGISKSLEPTDEETMQALKTTDYGLCAYRANNDVADHQTVNMEFAGGVTATLIVNAFNQGGRHIRIFGTKGELFAYRADSEINVYTFEDQRKWTVSVPKTDETLEGGHGGGDKGIVRELYEYMCGDYTGCRIADIQESVRNHMIGFAAEESRHTDTVVNLQKFSEKYGF